MKFVEWNNYEWNECLRGQHQGTTDNKYYTYFSSNSFELMRI